METRLISNSFRIHFLSRKGRERGREERKMKEGKFLTDQTFNKYTFISCKILWKKKKKKKNYSSSSTFPHALNSFSRSLWGFEIFINPIRKKKKEKKEIDKERRKKGRKKEREKEKKKKRKQKTYCHDIASIHGIFHILYFQCLCFEIPKEE